MPWEEPIFDGDGNLSKIKCKVHTKIHTSRNHWSQNEILFINMLGKGRMKKGPRWWIWNVFMPKIKQCISHCVNELYFHLFCTKFKLGMLKKVERRWFNLHHFSCYLAKGNPWPTMRISDFSTSFLSWKAT